MSSVRELLATSTLTVLVINCLLAWSAWLPLSTAQFSMMSAGLASIGAYTTGWLLLHGMSLGSALLAGALLAAALNLAVGSFSIRLSGYSFALATLAVSEGVGIVITGSSSLGGATGLIGIPTSPAVLYIGLVACVVAIALCWLLRRSRFGRYLDIVAADPLQAKALGVPVARVKLCVSLGQGLAAGLAGGLLACYVGYVSPDEFGLSLLTSVIAYVVLGGLASYAGPFVGATLLTLALQYFSAIGTYRNIAFGLLIVIVILLRRDGLVVRSAFLQRRHVRRLVRKVWAQHEGIPADPNRKWLLAPSIRKARR